MRCGFLLVHACGRTGNLHFLTLDYAFNALGGVMLSVWSLIILLYDKYPFGAGTISLLPSLDLSYLFNTSFATLFRYSVTTEPMIRMRQLIVLRPRVLGLTVASIFHLCPSSNHFNFGSKYQGDRVKQHPSPPWSCHQPLSTFYLLSQKTAKRKRSV